MLSKKLEKRKMVIEYLENHACATTLEIKRNIKVKVEEVFDGGIKEAYNAAGVDLPRQLRKRSKEACREEVVNYINDNSSATVSEIERNLKVNVHRLFGGIKQAFDAAGVEYPEEKRLEVCIKNLPEHPFRESQRFTNNVPKNFRRVAANFNRLFSSVSTSGLAEPSVPKDKMSCHHKVKIERQMSLAPICVSSRRKSIRHMEKPTPVIINSRKDISEHKKKLIIETLKSNPLYSRGDLEEMFHVNMSSFGGFENLCKIAGVEFLIFQKRRLKKQRRVIDYIKRHPNATQWEINRECKTKVQNLFDDGIREAFVKSGVKYPERRRILYGASRLSIRKRAVAFQDRVVDFLKCFGDVDTQVRTRNGIADAVLHYRNDILPVEVKYYKSKPICKTELKQLLKYMEDLNCERGVIISNRSGKREFEFGKNKIAVISIREFDDYLEGLSANLVKAQQPTDGRWAPVIQHGDLNKR